jgi:hypothetical protein
MAAAFFVNYANAYYFSSPCENAVRESDHQLSSLGSLFAYSISKMHYFLNEI